MGKWLLAAALFALLALAGWIAGLCGIVLGLIIAVVLFSFYMAMQSGTGK